MTNDKANVLRAPSRKRVDKDVSPASKKTKKTPKERAAAPSRVRSVLKYMGYGILGLMALGLLGCLVGAAVIASLLARYSEGLPDYRQLEAYSPSLVSRVYAGDGRLLAEFAQEKRVFVPIAAIPDRVKFAFLSAEDQNFYTHEGVDLEAIIRAIVSNLRHKMGGDGGLQGGSTITQQVVKNFLLTNERTYERKIKEAILARRIEQAMGKERILELYLNEIFLGAGSYGVAAAALNYFNKSLEELTLSESALLAALPKAPGRYDPIKNPNTALVRRNWVLGRMVKDGRITQEEAEKAAEMPIKIHHRSPTEVVSAPYFAEEVRRELMMRYGSEGVYEGGLAVRASVDPVLQDAAMRALRKGLMEYDQRHGWRGSLPSAAWESPPDGVLPTWHVAKVEAVEAATAHLSLKGGGAGTLPLEGAKWAQKTLDNGEGYRLAGAPRSMSDVVAVGDIILVEPIEGKGKTYALRQIPAVQGAILALDPATGRVLAMQGGWAQEGSEYNRATQAKRQPGSAFKPFVYLAALEAGFTPATLVMDAPFAIEDRPGHLWSPENYDGDFLGPTTLRRGLEKSRNLMTVRLAHYLGMDTIVVVVKRFGVVDDMPPVFSASLGSVETTLLRLTAAYAVFANGGKKVIPTFIDRIQDRNGKTIFRHDKRECTSCGPDVEWMEDKKTPTLPDEREQIVDPATAYQMVSMLEGVAQRGTAARLASSLKRPIAGKTGTTNRSNDAWFVGFSPGLVVGVFIGFDEPRSLGLKETGSSAALPVFEKFMKEALEDRPIVPFKVPPGVRLIKIDANTGVRAGPQSARTLWEVFVKGTEPNSEMVLLDDSGIISTPTIPSDESGDSYSHTDESYSPYSDDSSSGSGGDTGTGGIY